MAMGNNEKVVLNGEMKVAKTHFAIYRDTLKKNQTALENAINNLFQGFQGQAADGFKEFYIKNVKPVFENGGILEQYLDMFDKDEEGLFDCIEKAFITGNGVDPTLGANNRTIGQEK